VYLHNTFGLCKLILVILREENLCLLMYKSYGLVIVQCVCISVYYSVARDVIIRCVQKHCCLQLCNIHLYCHKCRLATGVDKSQISIATTAVENSRQWDSIAFNVRTTLKSVNFPFHSRMRCPFKSVTFKILFYEREYVCCGYFLRVHSLQL